MKDRFSLSICRRATDYVVVPQSGGGGLYFAVEPVERVPADVDALAKAIERAAAASDLSLGTVNLRDYKSPVPKALGLQSNKQFERSVVAMCSVYTRGGEIEIMLQRRGRDGRGFESTDRELAVAPEAHAIARAVLELLQQPDASA